MIAYHRYPRPAPTLAAALLAVSALLAPAAAGPALLFDLADGRIFYAEDQDDLWHPASLTKIMTAYLAFGAVKSGRLTHESKIVFSAAAVAQQPSKVGLAVGQEMTVDKALQALIVKSANDVAVALAEAVGGTQEAFIDQMNATAKQLGMTRTKFANPNGLPAPDQVTTARDLAKLARAVMRDFPEYAALWSQSDVQIGRLKLSTHNRLLKSYDGADGLKTGFICDSGFNVVATATRENRRLGAVVLGEVSGRDRSVRAASLLEHGFQTGGWTELFAKHATLDTMPMAELKGPTTMRDAVVAWDCGQRGRVRALAKSQQKRKQAATVRAAAAKGGTQPKAAPAVKTAAGPDKPDAGAATPAKARPKVAKPAKPAAAPAAPAATE